MLFNGAILVADGAIAISENCCCDVSLCECPCLYLQNKWDTVQGLSVDIAYPGGCGGHVTTLGLIHSGCPSPPPGYDGDCPIWGVLNTDGSFGTYSICVYCTNGEIRVAFTQLTLAGASCKVGDEGVPIEPTFFECDESSMIAEFSLSISQGGSMIPCPCLGEMLFITVY